MGVKIASSSVAGKIRNESVAVGAAVVTLSQPKLRKFIYIRNTSAAGAINVMFSNNETASATAAGFVLNPNEYVIDTDSGDAYECWNGTVTAYGVAGTTVSVVERI